MSEKILLVVESPSKAKTINKYLGKDYIVEASIGHIKDLVKFKMGVDIENGFEPKYITVKGKGDLIKKLKKLASEASEVLIATDPDREGEAIAWHIAEEVGKSNKNIKRVLFNEITKEGIKKGIKEPRDIDINLFMAQQARRVMDRLIGYQVSPFLSRALIAVTSEPLSAGRVQSVALRMIVEREREIRDFKSIPYFTINADFKNPTNATFNADLIAFDGNKIKNPEGSGAGKTDEETKAIQSKVNELHYIKSESQAKELVERIKKENFSIDEIKKRQVKRNPFAPFTTSTIQQEASRRLGFSNKKTMSIAQRLYEGVNIGSETVGLITYMRTDSVRVSAEAIEMVRGFIGKQYGNNYIPESPNEYKTKSTNSQDAHEAIRPANLDYKPQDVKQKLDKDEYALYELIFSRFVASQMAPALLDQTTAIINGGKFTFRVSGSVVVFNGFLAVYNDVTEEKNKRKAGEGNSLPIGLAEKQALKTEKVNKEESTTNPPARYNEASLVKDLDELGIGRPSTYAQIVSTLTDREYVELKSKVFYTTSLGESVTDVLIKYFPDLFNVVFTSEMENGLDSVEAGDNTYVKMMTEFYFPFKKSLDYAEEHSDIEDVLCEKCNAPMVIRVGRSGRFFGCSRYPECNGTKPLPKVNNGVEEEKVEPEIAEGISCDICGKPMYIRNSKSGKFYGCSDYPTCKGLKPITTGVTCPKCNKGEISERYSKKTRKKFYSCTNYPECDFISNFMPIIETCKSCNNHYIELRWKKTEDGFDKYAKCPKCNNESEVKE